MFPRKLSLASVRVVVFEWLCAEQTCSFRVQGDEERKRNVPISPFMVREHSLFS
jgi:hypothetical protein